MTRHDREENTSTSISAEASPPTQQGTSAPADDFDLDGADHTAVHDRDALESTAELSANPRAALPAPPGHRAPSLPPPPAQAPGLPALPSWAGGHASVPPPPQGALPAMPRKPPPPPVQSAPLPFAAERPPLPGALGGYRVPSQPSTGEFRSMPKPAGVALPVPPSKFFQSAPPSNRGRHREQAPVPLPATAPTPPRVTVVEPPSQTASLDTTGEAEILESHAYESEEGTQVGEILPAASAHDRAAPPPSSAPLQPDFSHLALEPPPSEVYEDIEPDPSTSMLDAPDSRPATLPLDEPLPALPGAPAATDALDSTSFDVELEARLTEQRDWLRLVELYLSQAPRDPETLIDHLVRAGELLEQELLQAERAFFVYLDALLLDPFRVEAALGIERAARELGAHAKPKWAEATRRLKRYTDDIDAVPEVRAEHYALAHRWYTNELKRRDVAAEQYTRLADISPKHPVVLERKANEARARGDARLQQQLLLESLPYLGRSDDRVRIRLALAELLEGPLGARGRALEHYEAVLAEDPNHFEALRGLERSLREGHDPTRLREVLEHLVAAASTPKERLEALVRLAEAQEKELADPEAAAATLEEALGVDGNNAKALTALERCYEALGRWSDVAQVMQRRADASSAPRAKIELYFAAADILEKRANEPDGAMESLRLVLVVDEKNRRALTELRRLTEYLGHYDEALSLGSRLAEVTPDKREAARIMVELGQTLEDRAESQLARVHYERALELDKRNLTVHEALERLARLTDEPERARYFLEKRAQLTDDKIEAAELYVQLAQDRQTAGDLAGSSAAYELARAADVTNEKAASALLDMYVEHNDYRAVEPLLEMLITAARKAGDDVRTMHLLRLATRTAASLGKLDRALYAAMAAFDQDPNDLGARKDLLEVTARVSPDKLLLARDHLARLAGSSKDADLPTLVHLAEVQQRAGDPRRAIATLEHAIEIAPGDPIPLEALTAILEAEQMWERLAECKLQLARALRDPDAQFVQLSEAGDLFARRLSDVGAATTTFEEARTIKPEDPWLLDTLAWAYRQLEDWNKLVESLSALIEVESDNAEKQRDLLLELADVQANQLHDSRAAAASWERVLTLDPSHLKSFEDLVRAYTDERDWLALERAYDAMLQRLGEDAQSSLRGALWRQLGLVRRDRLGDNRSALDAFRTALSITPEEEELHRIVVELELLTDNLDGAIAQARARVRQAPFETSTYTTLYDLFLRKGSYDLAWCALDVMAQLVQLEGEEDEFYRGYAPYGLRDIPGTLSEEAWQSHLLDNAMDSTLTSLFAWATPAEIRIMEGSARHVGEVEFAPSSIPLGQELGAMVENGSEILGMVNAPLVLGNDRHIPIRPASSPLGAFLVSPEAVAQNSDTLLFHVGRALSALRSELMPLAFFTTPADLANFMTRLVRKDAQLYSAMTPEEQQTVSLVISQAQDDAAKFDIKTWFVRAHAACSRASVLIAGSVHEAAVHYSREEDDNLASEKLTELYCFAVSEEHTELRTAIGVAIAQNA